MVGYCEAYQPDFVLMGLPKLDFQDLLESDLRESVQVGDGRGKDKSGMSITNGLLIACFYYFRISPYKDPYQSLFAFLRTWMHRKYITTLFRSLKIRLIALLLLGIA